MSKDHLVTGLSGEREAVRFLKKCKYKILARNYTCPLGELDIVALRDDELVFVEVKTRRNVETQPEERVDFRKRRKLTSLANYFVAQKHLERFCCRFDIVAVRFDADGHAQIDHYPDAFDAT